MAPTAPAAPARTMATAARVGRSAGGARTACAGHRSAGRSGSGDPAGERADPAVAAKVAARARVLTKWASNCAIAWLQRSKDGRERMTYETVEAKAGPTLYVSAAATVASLALAIVYLISYFGVGLQSPLLRQIGAGSLIGLVLMAPIALATSLLVRCRACDRLLIPLVYNGKSFFTSRLADRLGHRRTAVMILFRRRAPCPHCLAEAEV